MTALHIRPVEDGDRTAVAALCHACSLTKPYNPQDRDIAFCRASSTSELFVADDDGHRGWLSYVAVDPSRRGAGLSRQMIAHAEASLAGLGVPKVNLIICDTNPPVQAFYENIGYEVEPRTQMARWLVDKPGG